MVSIRQRIGEAMGDKPVSCCLLQSAMRHLHAGCRPMSYMSRFGNIARFSEGVRMQNKSSSDLVQRAMVPAPIQYEAQSFSLETDAAGNSRLNLSLADTRRESSVVGKSYFFGCLRPGRAHGVLNGPIVCPPSCLNSFHLDE